MIFTLKSIGLVFIQNRKLFIYSQQSFSVLYNDILIEPVSKKSFHNCIAFFCCTEFS